jgi:hypothetical protein
MKRTARALMALLLLLGLTVGCPQQPTKVKIEPGDKQVDPQPKMENPNPKSKKAG